ncbi:MAG: fasciclin domain-containing protein [Myxococcota bacterium]
MMMWLAATAFGADLVDTAVQDGRFQTLTQALEAADLVETLRGPGPFTVFAPTDDAFAALPPDTLPTLLDPKNRGLLNQILTFHVASGRANAERVQRQGGVISLAGQRIDAQTSAQGLVVEGAQLVRTDIETSNGIIHVIDAVMVPESRNLATVARDAGSFGTLLAAAEAAGLIGVLTGDDPFTVFAPTDEAFRALPEGTVDRLLQPENREELRQLLTYHVVPGNQFANRIARQSALVPVQGSPLPIKPQDGTLRVGQARVIQADIEAANGVIHVIDGVLMPPQDVDAVLGVIDAAIQRGAPLFNHGQTQACYAIYEVTAKALLALGDDRLSDRARRRLTEGLATAARRHNPGRAAWDLRHALDEVSASLQLQM